MDSWHGDVMDWAARLRAFWVRRIWRRPILFRDRHGFRYFLRPTDDLALYFRHRGWFEETEQSFCRRHLRPGMTAFDVGAYIGVYSLLMAQTVGPEGRVHVFEPSPIAFQRLLDNIAVNRFGNIVTNRQAVCSENGRRLLHCYASPLESLSSLVHQEVKRVGTILRPISQQPVETVNLDEYCRRNGVKRIDLLKIDVEGAEAEVLSGARALLECKAIRCVLLEVGGAIANPWDCLTRHGYRLFVIAGDGHLTVPREAEIRQARSLVAFHADAHRN